jgi:hypothetical protein
MTEPSATATAKQITVEATVFRADGRIEHLGTVASWHRSPFKRLAARVRGEGRVNQSKENS